MQLYRLLFLDHWKLLMLCCNLVLSTPIFILYSLVYVVTSFGQRFRKNLNLICNIHAKHTLVALWCVSKLCGDSMMLLCIRNNRPFSQTKQTQQFSWKTSSVGWGANGIMGQLGVVKPSCYNLLGFTHCTTEKPSCVEGG